MTREGNALLKLLDDEKKSFNTEVVTLGDIVGLDEKLYKYFSIVLQLENYSNDLSDEYKFLNQIDLADAKPWDALQESVANRAPIDNKKLTILEVKKLERLNKYDDLLLTFQPDTEEQSGVLRTLTQWERFKEQTIKDANINFRSELEKNNQNLREFIKKGLHEEFISDLIVIIITIESLIEAHHKTLTNSTIIELLKVHLEIPMQLKRRHHRNEQYSLRQNFLDLLNDVPKTIQKKKFNEFFVMNDPLPTQKSPANNAAKLLCLGY